MRFGRGTQEHAVVSSALSRCSLSEACGGLQLEARVWGIVFVVSSGWDLPTDVSVHSES